VTAGFKTIHCPACQAESLLKRKPRYEGFKKVGETLSCADCGHEFPDEAGVPFAEKARPHIFSEADAPNAVRVFNTDEKGKFCRYCRHYVVNPFTQRCSLHRRLVQATDICPQFDPKPETEEEPS
jgi:hypothetical protein